MYKRIYETDDIIVDYYDDGKPMIRISVFEDGHWVDEHFVEGFESVVHAHWEKFKHPSGTHGIRCSHCQTTNGRKSNYCPECGAIMDEKVFEPTPIGKLLFSMRVHKRLKQAGILTVEQLQETDKRTLRSIEGLGKESILEIEEKLAEWQEWRNKNG